LLPAKRPAVGPGSYGAVLATLARLLPGSQFRELRLIVSRYPGGRAAARLTGGATPPRAHGAYCCAPRGVRTKIGIVLVVFFWYSA
jgi:hypothetical protein